MSNIKINSNLFLGSAELNRLQYFLANQGYQKALLQDAVNFGLIKSNADITFQNGLIQQDTDVISGSVTFKSIKCLALQAIDLNGNFLTQALVNNILIPGDDNWYWVKVTYAISNIEQGTFSIDNSGNLTGSGGNLTAILRGAPNIMSRVRFPNATSNTLDYDILSVIDDNTAILNGASFTSESGLQLAVVGSFTYGAAVLDANKLIFNYDSCTLSLVPEATTNTPPTSGFTEGLTFYLARVKSDGTNLIIQDKRTDYFETKGSELVIDIDRNANALVGIESSKYNTIYSPGDKNVVQVAWGFRSNNWTVNTTTNVFTISSGLGGKYKSTSDFNNGDFDGWRIYFPTGKYSRVISSIAHGSAINLTLDTFDVNNLSNDGGETFLTSEYIVVVPNAEEIEFLFNTNPSDNQSYLNRNYTFNINELFGICEVEVYNSPNVLYNVQYRYKTLKDYTEFEPIPSDTTHGYYLETSFDSNGNLHTDPTQIFVQTYTNDPVNGFIQLTLSSNSYKNFVFRVDKGDLVGVNYVSSLPTLTTLTVGSSYNYLKITGAISLSNNTTIVLSGSGTVNGNEFRIHFNCTSITFNGFTLQIVDGSTSSTIKSITQGDAYQMLNIDGGIIFDCVYGTSWNIYQNYELGRSNEVIQIFNSNPSTLFDSSKMGKIKGLYGYSLSDGSNGSPNLSGMFIVGYSATDSDYSTIGNIGGTKTNVLTINQLPAAGITISYLVGNTFAGSGSSTAVEQIGTSGATNTGNTLNLGSGNPIENRPPYYTLIYAYKTF